MEKIASIFAERLYVFLNRMLDLVPYLLITIVILAAGFVTAYLVRHMTARVLRAVNFDKWSDEMGLSIALHKGRIKTPPSTVISVFLHWLVIVVFLMIWFGSLGLTVTDTIVAVFFMYLPRFFSAVVIMVLGYLLAGFFSRGALLAGVNAGIEHSRLMSEAVRMFILILIFAMALEQLAIAPKIVFAAFSIFFGGVLLALAIAFGLGGRDAAKELIDDMRKKGEKNDIEHL